MPPSSPGSPPSTPPRSNATRSGHAAALELAAARQAEQVGGLQRQLGAAERDRDNAFRELHRLNDEPAAADQEAQ
jgi:hypothetical protein